MYRETPRSRKYRLMREAKERRRIESAAPRERFDPPAIRREIIVRDYDFGEREFRM